MAIERTLILIKPDAVSRGLIGEITARIERRGYVISAMKLIQVDGGRAREHYAEHKGKAFFDDLVAFITSAPLVAMAVEGQGAIDGCRQIIGATNPLDAAPGSIRGDLAQTIGRNLVHGSDGPASAQRELGLFFEDREFVSRRHDLDRWIKE
jgi:nucleoside-diphosphate kinase